jgi:hypothetical protein
VRGLELEAREPVGRSVVQEVVPREGRVAGVVVDLHIDVATDHAPGPGQSQIPFITRVLVLTARSYSSRSMMGMVMVGVVRKQN